MAIEYFSRKKLHLAQGIQVTNSELDDRYVEQQVAGKQINVKSLLDGTYVCSSSKARQSLESPCEGVSLALRQHVFWQVVLRDHEIKARVLAVKAGNVAKHEPILEWT